LARTVTKTELAKMVGVTKAAITKACVKAFPDALIGPRVDFDHPQVQRYLLGRGRGSTNLQFGGVTAPYPPPAPRPVQSNTAASLSRAPAKQPAWPNSAPNQPAKPPAQPGAAASDDDNREATPDDIARYANLTLDQLTRRFGTSTAFKDWLEARQRISAIREKDLKNDERSGRLITRELVKTHVFSHIEAANRRLLQDAATTIARRLYAAAKGGTPVEEAEQTVRDILGSHLRPLKATAARVLRGGIAEVIDDGLGSEARVPD
jgi:hypothetical protein